MLAELLLKWPLDQTRAGWARIRAAKGNAVAKCAAFGFNNYGVGIEAARAVGERGVPVNGLCWLGHHYLRVEGAGSVGEKGRLV